METAGPGLLLVMMDIDPEHEEEFNRWYEEEHLPERLGIAGIRSARRFRAVEGAPRYLALYELESPAVLDSDAYAYYYEGEGRTAWTERILGKAKNFVRNVYVEITPGVARS